MVIFLVEVRNRNTLFLRFVFPHLLCLIDIDGAMNTIYSVLVAKAAQQKQASSLIKIQQEEVIDHKEELSFLSGLENLGQLFFYCLLFAILRDLIAEL